MPFENVLVPVPEKYDCILKKMHGDYWEPIRNIAGHEYPFYKRQKEIVEELLRSEKKYGKI